MDSETAARAADDGDTPNFLISTESGRQVAVTGQTVKRWVQSGRIMGYRIGTIAVPAEAVDAYVAMAGASLDLPEVSDEEVAALVEEARGKRG
ncbi:MAG TPA: hypothetical protein VFW96_26370 [Thermomicrobiales bacterium]|nr:hypothetical protein [Thermomicrobiales bacterium]